jgi:hypothetical protein
LSSNPYSPPLSNVEQTKTHTAVERERLEKVRTGQRLVIWSILLYFGMGALSILSGNAPALANLLDLLIVAMLVAMFVMSFMGMFRMWSGLGTPLIYRVVMFLLMLVPLIGLLILVRSSAKATKTLKENGYRVGLLGAEALAPSRPVWR